MGNGEWGMWPRSDGRPEQFGNQAAGTQPAPMNQVDPFCAEGASGRSGGDHRKEQALQYRRVLSERTSASSHQDVSKHVQLGDVFREADLLHGGLARGSPVASDTFRNGSSRIHSSSETEKR